MFKKNSFLLILIFSLTLNAQAQKEQDCDEDGKPLSKQAKLAHDLKRTLDRKSLSSKLCEALILCSEKAEGEKIEMSKSALEECETGMEHLKMARENITDAKVGTCGLSNEELVILAYYMGDGYLCMNKHIWKPQDSSPKVSYLVQSLNKLLKKFPQYQGFVRRGTNLPSAIKAQHILGATVTYPAFTSSSTESSTATSFAGDGGSHFLIHSTSGRPIMGIEKGEYEVLFSANTRFKILNTQNKGSESFYLMREVAPNETKSQSASKDKEVLEQALQGKAEKAIGADSWSCPMDSKLKLPSSIAQKIKMNTMEFIKQ